MTTSSRGTSATPPSGRPSHSCRSGTRPSARHAASSSARRMEPRVSRVAGNPSRMSPWLDRGRVREDEPEVRLVGVQRHASCGPVGVVVRVREDAGERPVGRHEAQYRRDDLSATRCLPTGSPRLGRAAEKLSSCKAEVPPAVRDLHNKNLQARVPNTSLAGHTCGQSRARPWPRSRARPRKRYPISGGTYLS